MTERIYLDWNASAPLRHEARAAALAALEVTGNPSSVHVEGRAARRLIEQARDQVAALVGADPRNVVFTSGGTEANMLALVPAIDGTARDKLLVSAIEHPSVLAGGGRAVGGDRWRGDRPCGARTAHGRARGAGARFAHARQQRDRCCSTDFASRKRGARWGRAAARRRGPGRRSNFL